MQLTRLNPPLERNGFKFYPTVRFSPDGKTIAVGGTSLYFTSTPGQKSPLEGQKYLGGEVDQLAWSPDSRALALISVQPGDKVSYTLSIQPISKDVPAAGTSFYLDTKINGHVDWSR